MQSKSKVVPCARVIGETGLGWDVVRHVILTHHHGDHAGSIGDVLGRAWGATAWAGAADIPSIRAPRDVQPAADGDDIFGLRVVSTPGHTAGHISIFDPVGSALILGDAAVNTGGNLSLSSPQFTANADQARESVGKIAGLTFENALFMHDQSIEGGAAARFQQLVSRLNGADGALAHAPAQDGHVCL